MKSYPNIKAFYSENEARLRSGEADYGVWWHDGVGSEFWRVSYVQATGEVYAARHQDGPVEVLGIVPPDTDNGGRYYRTLDQLLEGWSQHCGKLNSLAWVREKLAQSNQGGCDESRHGLAHRDSRAGEGI